MLKKQKKPKDLTPFLYQCPACSYQMLSHRLRYGQRCPSHKLLMLPEGRTFGARWRVFLSALFRRPIEEEPQSFVLHSKQDELSPDTAFVCLGCDHISFASELVLMRGQQVVKDRGTNEVRREESNLGLLACPHCNSVRLTKTRAAYDVIL